MRRALLSMLCSAAALVALGGCATGAHPALAVLDPTQTAEPDADAERFISPYFANLTALYGLRNGGDCEPVREYLQWYLDNLNYPDIHGLTGTIYDFELRGRQQTATGSYDSADSYAATFLLLLEEYGRRSGDRQLAIRNRDVIADIAWLMLYLQDADGLIRAVPWDNARYLMDNCEDYGGLLAMSRLCEDLGWPNARRYREAAAAVRRGVMQVLAPGSDAAFKWASAGTSYHESSWDKYYPDAYAQLFPVLFGLVKADSEQARRIWREFSSRYDPRDGYEVESVQRIVIDMTREQVES